MLFSYIFNVKYIKYNDCVEILRPFYFFSLIMLFNNKKKLNMDKKYLKFLVVFGLIQIGVVSLQYFDLNIIHKIYPFYRSSKIELNAMRFTGTLGNPNIYGFHIINSILALIFLKDIKYKKILYLIFFLGIMMSGSIFLIPITFILIIISLILRKKDKINIIYLTIYFCIFLILGGTLLKLVLPILTPYFPRLERLSDINVSNILELKNFRLRIEHWKSSFSLIKDENIIRSFLIGGSSRKYYGFRVMDNEYLFIFFRYGIFGIISFGIIIVRFFLTYSKNLSSSLCKIGYLNIILFIISGTLYETFSVWRLMHLYLFPFLLYSGTKTTTIELDVI